ncbi:MAG: phosphatase PAP2 family protein, partial [Sandaracinaceae bacterium]|nr:phosphatase PAP2 family protein [Sandaracinaceae bacterium]
PAQSLESQQRSGAPAERALLGSLESFFGKEPDRIESPDGPKDASFEESEGAAPALSEADDRMDNSDAEARPIDLFAEDALLRAVRAAAPEIASEAVPQPTAKRPLLVEDRFRYGNLWLIPRGVLSGVAIPLSIPYWSPHEITRMVATTATVTTMMLPLGPSLDVRIYRAMQSARTPFLDALFPKIYTIPMTLGIAAYTTILSAGFYFFKRPRLREYVSLMLEALGIVQFYHVSLKLLIGREGPYQGVGEGRVFGPTRVFFPGGTPSGHTASAFAILVTAAEYYGTWPIRILAYVGASYMATSFAYNNQHFASDVIWGAMMGDTVARWVVRHRSSANRGPSLRPKLQAAPMVVPGGAGFSLSLSGGGFL